MHYRVRATFAWVAVLLVAAGCSSSTDPEVVTDFQWTEADPTTSEEGTTATAALGELFVLGHILTPTRCYKLAFDLGKSASRLDLRIKASTSSTPNCDQAAGAYRYTLAIYNLRSGTYEVRVIHDVAGGQERAFTTTVTIR